MKFQLMSWEGLLDLSWLIFLVLLFIYFWRVRHQLLQAKLWIKTEGRITHFEWIHEGHSVWPKIEYTYEAQGQTWTGDQFFLDTAHRVPNSPYARKIAYKVAHAYKHDQLIEIYYNPDRPHQALLDITIPTKLNVILVLLSILIGAQLITLLYASAK